MQHLLAQGGSGGSWFSPGMVKPLIYLGIGLIWVISAIAKKVAEKNAKRAAELAALRRRDEILRTGRDETGAFVDVSRADSIPQAAPAADPRQRLQELAERRRQELAASIAAARARPAAPPAASRPGRQAPPRAVPPIIDPAIPVAPPAARPPARMPAPPSFGGRQPNERDIRKQREQQSNKKAATAAAARRKAQEAARPAPAEPAPVAPRPSSANAAYDLPTDRQYPATAAQQSTASKVGAALARAGGGATASEWRKAIVLSELLHRPVAMRAPGEQVP